MRRRSCTARLSENRAESCRGGGRKMYQNTRGRKETLMKQNAKLKVIATHNVNRGDDLDSYLARDNARLKTELDVVAEALRVSKSETSLLSRTRALRIGGTM